MKTDLILPSIGQPLYAGLSIHEGEAVALVLLPEDLDDAPWDKAVAWAKEQGGDLPSRIDQLVLFRNLKSGFEERAYWSNTPYAGDDAFAWAQNFLYGGQLINRKSAKLRARAVRRIAI